jgi:hypothetical protein
MSIIFTTYNAWWKFKPKSVARQIYDAYEAVARYDAMMKMKELQQAEMESRIELEIRKLQIQAEVYADPLYRTCISGRSK